MPETLRREGGLSSLDVADGDEACRRPSLAARRKRAGLLRRDVAARLGIRPSVISSIEKERAKHVAAMDAYEAFLDGVERLNNAG